MGRRGTAAVEHGGRRSAGPASRWALLAFAAVALLSLYVLFSPSPGGPALFDGADKIVHASLFALLTGTAIWAFGARPAYVLLLGTYAVLSEVVQALALPHRSGDWRDVVADLVGVVLVCVLTPLLSRRP